MRSRLAATTAAVAFCLSVIQAAAQDLIFMLDNQSSYAIFEFYASPSDVGTWEEDILGASILPSGQAMRVTIADGRAQCEYDLRFVFEDDDVFEDTADLCETGSYTVTD